MLYEQYFQKAISWSNGYERAALENRIVDLIRNRELAAEQDQAIIDLDHEAKNSDSSLQKLIDDRRKAEIQIKQEIDPQIEKYEGEIRLLQTYLNRQMKLFDKATSDLESSKKIENQIQLMNTVKNTFEQKLSETATEYSKRLCVEIQALLDEMLTSKRKVTVSSDFTMKVVDNYNDESKSEGQFAVVSFAYIGGVLKLLKSEESLKSKEYPLVLDGPFSKLGEDHRKNVIDTIPEYAPQIIIFSKDDLQSIFPEKRLGRVWTIQSNPEKNVASVKEGFLW